jgi:hypothetical protein
MDPLHPIVPIQPPAPTTPNYNRVQRVERDPEDGSGPDWQGKRGRQQPEQEPDDQFEDDYDPDWSDPAAAEPYGADGVQHESATAVEVELPSVEKWDPRTHGERRAHPRDGDDGGTADAPLAAGDADDAGDAGDAGDDVGPDPGHHIDISA